MNKKFKMIASNNVFMLLFLCTILLTQGCSKVESQGEQTEEIGAGKLRINVLGVIGSEAINNKGAKANVTSTVGVPSEIVSHKEGFDTRVSVIEDETMAGKIVSIANNDISGQNGTARAESVQDSVFYRLIIEKKSDNSIVHNKIMASGRIDDLQVDAGVEYNWYAFSYNSAEAGDVPAFTNLASEVSMGDNKDFIFAKGTITPNPDNNVLGIVFSRQTARIGVELDTRGMFATLNSGTVAINGQLKSGTFNLKTGAATVASSAIATATSSKFVQAPDHADMERSVVYFYTVDATNLNPLTATIKALTINLDAYALSVGQTTRAFTGLTINKTSPNFKPNIGKSKTFKIDMIESAVTNAYTINDLIAKNKETHWSRANLYYDATKPAGTQYRFHHLNQQNQDNNTYFSFGALYPLQYVANNADVDPCKLVYPADTWRIANVEDYDALVGRPGVLGLGSIAKKNPTVAAGQYIQYGTTGSTNGYGNNALRFNMNGSAIDIKLVQGIIQLDLGSYGSIANYWTHDRLLDAGIIKLGAYHFQGKSNDQSVMTNVLDLQLLGGLNVLKSSSMNVRCVRK